jgi:hypothetical protein
MWRDKRHMNQADQAVSNSRGILKEQYGFVADDTKPLWENVQNIRGELNTSYYSSRPRKMAFHNYLEKNGLPPGTRYLLGYGLNYCITSKTIDTTANTGPRLRDDTRRNYALRDAEINDGNFIRGLYINSDFKFGPASDEVEGALDSFLSELKKAQHNNFRRRKRHIQMNLTPPLWKLMLFLRRHDLYIVIPADKNLGPCIMDRVTYIRKGCSEHLGNAQQYQILTAQQATTKMKELHYKLSDFRTEFHYKPKLDMKKGLLPQVTPISDAEDTFLLRAVKRNPDKLARFRMTYKIHKDPPKMRPIVCCSGTFMNDWSKWLDYQLQKLKPFVSSYLRDTQQLLNEMKQLNLPPNAYAVTADARSMYNFIDTNHAILVIGLWLDELADQLDNFPIEAVKYAMNIIMRNNIFEWGDLHFLQRIGTAMGTSAAVMWATIYFAYHEEKVILPKYGSNLLYYRRFIDDIFAIWIKDDTTAFDDFTTDLNSFGILEWDVDPMAKSVNFLDITATIRNGGIETRTYQKAMNLYLYLPPSSAHPRGCIKGIIYALISRYHAQNTHREDYIHFVRLLYRRLRDRGWDNDTIYPIFMEVATKMESRGKLPAVASSDNTCDDEMDKTIFIHLQYHTHDISRKQIRILWDKYCREVFQEEIGIERAIIAYSRPRNIGEYVTQAKLHQASGETSSTIMGEYNQGLAP